jgi:hypothetical protein
VVTLAVLLAEFASGVLLDTVALLVTLPTLFGVTVIVTVADAPAARPPRLHVTLPDEFPHDPCEAEADLNVTLLGSVSVTVTPDAAPGPLFVALTV